MYDSLCYAVVTTATRLRCSITVRLPCDRIARLPCVDCESYWSPATVDSQSRRSCNHSRHSASVPRWNGTLVSGYGRQVMRICYPTTAHWLLISYRTENNDITTLVIAFASPRYRDYRIAALSRALASLVEGTVAKTTLFVCDKIAHCGSLRSKTKRN